jgi:hypothetical protein
MKKNLIILLLFVHLLFFGQRDLTGIYCNYDYSYGCIKIENDKFYFIIKHDYTPFWCADTLANATFKRVDDNFIELNSTPPYILAQKGFNIVQSFDSTIQDSIKVSFSIPNFGECGGDLDIKLWTDRNKVFKFIYSEFPDNNKELMLPNYTKTISLNISPQYSRESHRGRGLYYGTLYYSPRETITVEKNVNHILIEIPAIDGAFFERYYLMGDYAKVSNDTITWKGEVFIKRE